jgi:hypothetical protein
MPNPNRRRCIICGKHVDEVGPLSWNGYCTTDGLALLEENVRGIHERRGPAHRRRLRGLAAYLERELLDESRKSA